MPERADHRDIGRSVGELLASDSSEGLGVGLEVKIVIDQSGTKIFHRWLITELGLDLGWLNLEGRPVKIGRDHDLD